MTNKTWLHTFVGAVAIVAAVAALATPAAAQGRRRAVGITVFTNPNYGGQSASFRDDTPDLRGYALNDKISSIEIGNGETWEICQDINYANRCVTLTGSVPNLKSMGWNDRISSLRRVRGFNGGGYGNNRGNNGTIFPLPGNNRGEPQIVFFDQPGFRGQSTVITNSAANIGSNRSGSLQVRGGGSWIVCDRDGRCATVNQNVNDLARIGLSGRIQSIRPANGNYGNGNRDRDWGRRY